jgi:hypothetical protein
MSEQEVTKEQIVSSENKLMAGILKTAAQSPTVIERLAEQGLEIDNEQLDAAIEDILKSPEIDAMLENVAADAAEDAQNELAKGQPFDPTAEIHPTFQAINGSLRPDYLTWREFKTFEERVAKAFKHTGFKF